MHGYSHHQDVQDHRDQHDSSQKFESGRQQHKADRDLAEGDEAGIESQVKFCQLLDQPGWADPADELVPGVELDHTGGPKGKAQKHGSQVWKDFFHRQQEASDD